MEGIHRRVTRSPSTGRTLDECIADGTSEDVLHRLLRHPDDIRVQIAIQGASAMFTTTEADVSEVYSQQRITQQEALQGMRPGWSHDLTLNDPFTGAPWDLSLPATRDHVRRLVSDAKPFMLIGSPLCMAFSSLQKYGRSKRDPKITANNL